MTWYLEDNPPVRSQGRPRREPPRVMMLHTVEMPPDYVGEDFNAEKAAEYGQRKTNAGSYHSIGDRDSIVRNWNPETTIAYGCRFGVNEYALHFSMATKASEFRDFDGWQITDGSEKSVYALQAAEEVALWSIQFNIPLVFLTREQVLNGHRGVTTHAEVDPQRRYDPGWDANEMQDFLAVAAHRVQVLTNPNPVVSAGSRIVARTIPTGFSFNSAAHRWPMWTLLESGKLIPTNGAYHAGDAEQYNLTAPATDILSTESGLGYWIICGDGGIFNFGNAWYPASHADFMINVAPELVGDVVMGVLVDDAHIQLIASDGGVFDFYR